MATIKIDMTSPDPRSETVEIETPAGTIRVTTGIVGVIRPGVERQRVIMVIEEAEGWSLEFNRDDLLGEARIIQQGGH